MGSPYFDRREHKHKKSTKRNKTSKMVNNMLNYWEGHAKRDGATQEAMMLDKNASEFSDRERDEILSIVPDVTGLDIIELGSGIGRFTPLLAGKAKSVIAVEFIEDFHKKNEEINGHLKNVRFECKNVLDLELPEGSLDMVFSNWLMMYLTDEEVLAFANKVLKWLKPGGTFFFRESCYRQSGTRSAKEDYNPTIYRKPLDYTHLVTSPLVSNEKFVQGLDIIFFRAIQTYIDVKNNRNQICWLVEKSQRDIEGKNQGCHSFQQFLDEKQYSKNGILRYERIFGKDYVSTGGLETTVKYCKQLNLKPDMKVLDVGSGIGGSAFHMVNNYGCEVVGIDLSVNMVEIGIEKLDDYKLHDKIRFEVADCTKRTFPDASFDVIYSRDTILHISDKPALFANFYKWLKPGGQVFITDYCANEQAKWNAEFSAYVASRGYDLHTPAKYGKMLEGVGFKSVDAQDATVYWRDILEREKAKLEGSERESFLNDFTQKDLDDLVVGWNKKLVRVDQDQQKWGVFHGFK